MDTVNARIRDVRKLLKKTQKEFAASLGMSENYIWQIEKEQRSPSERTVSDICRIFGVDEVWLRTGEGEPFSEAPDEDAIVAALAQAMGGNPSTAKIRLIRAIAKMPESYFPAIEQMISALAGELPPQPPKE